MYKRLSAYFSLRENQKVWKGYGILFSILAVCALILYLSISYLWNTREELRKEKEINKNQSLGIVELKKPQKKCPELVAVAETKTASAPKPVAVAVEKPKAVPKAVPFKEKQHSHARHEVHREVTMAKVPKGNSEIICNFMGEDGSIEKSKLVSSQHACHKWTQKLFAKRKEIQTRIITKSNSSGYEEKNFTFYQVAPKALMAICNFRINGMIAETRRVSSSEECRDWVNVLAKNNRVIPVSFQVN